MFRRYTDCHISSVYDEIFDPTEKCCICGGGEVMTQEVYDSIPENEFNCRTSDYRTVASDPNWDVTDVKADVNRESGLTLMALTAVQKT